MKCVVSGCRRARMAARNEVVYATCEAHARMEFEREPWPEWRRRMVVKGLPAKDYTAA